MRKILTGIRSFVKNTDVFGKKAFTVLYSSAFVCLMIIAVAQVGLRNTSTRQFFTKMDSYEGAYFEATAEVQSEPVHTMILSAEGNDFKDAQIYLNGESYSALTAGDNEIEIDVPAVIEVYSPGGAITVKLSHLSDSLILYTPDREVTVENGLKIFGRVGIK